MDVMNQNNNLNQIQEEGKKVILQSFDYTFLETVSQRLVGRIVEFDLSKNKSPQVYDALFQFIRKHSEQWKGLALNLRYQNKYIQQAALKELGSAIQNMKDLKTFSISFGGYIVSEFYAENNPKSEYEWDKCTHGLKKFYDNYKGLLENIATVVAASPKLKEFCLDFQGLGQDSIFMLPQLRDINIALSQCPKLERYTLSQNHCSIFENNQKTLTSFFQSFIFLKSAKFLKKFVLNIADWMLSPENYIELSKIFGEYLTHEKHQFIEFQFDHSSEQEFDNTNSTEMISLMIGLNLLLEAHQDTLKVFYLSLVQYRCYDKEISLYMEIFQHLSSCRLLERLSLRIQTWRCESILTEEKFYKQLWLLKDNKHLQMFHLSTFTTLLGKMSPFYQYGRSVIVLLGQLCRLHRKQVNQSQMILEYLQPYYRNDILNQLNFLCCSSTTELANPNFHLTQLY